MIIQVENYKRHKDILEQGPYIRKMDLAVNCRVLISITPREMRTARVTWDMLEQWDISPEELFRRAGEASRKQLPPIVEPMSDVIRGFLTDEFIEVSGEDEDTAVKKAEGEYKKLFGSETADMPEIYVLSNELRVQGAAVIFYTDVLKGFAEETGSDLILLPSSVHEWLVLLDSPSYDEENLEAMVREANAQVVMEDEVLSDHIYRYSRERNELFRSDMVKTLDKNGKNC